MNVKRFTARSSRDALVLVRQALGDDAVVLSTRPCTEGVEVLAMAPDSMRAIERMATPNVVAAVPATVPATARSQPTPVDDDLDQLSMSTLSFQDYVRDRMLKRRADALIPQVRGAAPTAEPASERLSVLEQRMAERTPVPYTAPLAAPSLANPPALLPAPLPYKAASPAAEIHLPPSMPMPGPARHGHDQQDMMDELRSMKGLIEERFGALAFMEKLNRQPGQARLTQKLLDCGFSPALIRKLGDSLPNDAADESAWAATVLERNLLTDEAEAALEDQGGVFALVGATGVGKTTTTAKIAAAFATKYGAAHLGLITLDAYRVGAHEQLRAYGRILGVPVHTAHDRASLDDLLELLAAKKMVLVDTAGMAQRDARTRELLEMLQHRSVQKLLVINAASQGETIEDVLIAYRAAACKGIVLSKMDEAVKLGPALDALIRHKLKVVGVANGQRVPEDWHRLGANALVQRALRSGGSSAYRLDSSDVSLIFTAPLGRAVPRAGLGA